MAVVAQLQDDGFHEIQLNGKQLVFLFMITTVVSVVIFLLGVFVGRGVRTERSAAESASTAIAEPAQQAPPPATTAATPAADPTKAEVPLTYFDLEKKNPPTEKLEKNEKKAAPRNEKVEPPAHERAPAPAPAAAPPAPAPAPEARTESEPSGSGYAVQIAALNVRSEADAIAKRLSSKGYSAYVMAPASGSPSVFRVRVGKFSTRREAENVAARLQKEEQYKPWVTR